METCSHNVFKQEGKDKAAVCSCVNMNGCEGVLLHACPLHGADGGAAVSN